MQQAITHALRLPGPTSRAEFEQYLELATKGTFISDTGQSQEVEDALDAIRTNPNPPQELLDAAREAYKWYRARDCGQCQV
jgi:hypothetical protein